MADRTRGDYMKPGIANNGRKMWTEEENTVLRKLYATTSIKKLAVILGRPVGSIGVQAYRLGVTKRDSSRDESRVGTVVRPRDGVLIHHSKRYGK